MSERQLAPDLSGIHPGHLERYFFASAVIKMKGGMPRVLDAACGCGYGSWIMQRHSRVTGIDLEQEAIDYAKRHYPGPDYFVSDVSQFEGDFDWVVSLETIEHLPNPVDALKKFRGSRRLIVSTPNQEQYPFEPHKFYGDRFPHLKHYSPNELEWLLRESGWKVMEKHCQFQKHSKVSDGTMGKFIVFVAE